MRFLIYKWCGIFSSLDEENKLNCTHIIWKPSFSNPVPPGYPSKYFIYYLWKLTGLFKNPEYYAVLSYVDNNLASSLLLVPGYYRWPFMSKNDLQITYVKTYPEYKGKGIATSAITFAIKSVNKEGRNFWYVTDSENIPSQKLASKCGFDLHGFGKREKLLYFIKRLKLLNDVQL